MSGFYKNLFEFKNKTVVVTGGLGYLGQEIVRALLDLGSNVAVFDNSTLDYKKVFKLKTLNRLIVLNPNLSHSIETRAAFQHVEDRFGVINSLINCAAYGSYPGSGSIETMSTEIWDEGIEGTLGITFKTIKESIPFIKKSRNASIVNFGSLYSWIAPDLSIYENNNGSPPNYGAGKAAIIQLTRHAASELSKYNIRVNSVSPGSFPHKATQKNRDFIGKLSKRNMMNRIGQPEDLIGAVLFLVSDGSLFITGTNINVDGGQLAW